MSAKGGRGRQRGREGDEIGQIRGVRGLNRGQSAGSRSPVAGAVSETATSW